MCAEYPDIFHSVVFLFGVGWLELLRLRPTLAARQCLWLVIAVFAAVILFHYLQPLSLLERHRLPILVSGLSLLASALVFGAEVNGAKLWLQFGVMSFQPIEVVKILLVIALASFWRRFRLWLKFSRNLTGSRFPRRGMVFLAIGWLLGLAILVVQRDLGMALLLIGVFFTMFYVATGRRDFVFLGVTAFTLASVGVVWFFDHVRIRIRAWWDPFLFADSDGYQLLQGLYGIADGGAWGRGWFLGKPHVVPEAHTDFILPAIGHELGWITAISLIFCVGHMGHLFFGFAARCKGEFRRLLLTGLASLWSLQCFIIIAGTTKIIPMTGLTLPFVSYGGSSLLANTILLALILRCVQRGS